MKKNWVITVVALAAIALAGCGNSKKAATKPAGPTAATLVKQSVTAQHEQKNVHMVMGTKINLGSDAMTMNVDANFVMKPVAFLGTYKIATGSTKQTLKVYMAAKTCYAYTAGKWMDLSAQMSNSGLDISSLQKQVDGSTVSNLPKKTLKAAKLTKANGQYTMVMTVSGKDAKAMIKKGAANLPSQASAALDEIDVSKINYTYVVDAKTKLPVRLDAKIKMSAKGDKMTETLTASFSKWGEAPVTAPQVN